MSWELTLLAGQRYGVFNRTGEDAVDVTIRAVGSLVVHGTAGWRRHLDRVPQDEGVEFTCTFGSSAPNDRPGVQIVWSTDDEPDDSQLTTLRFPGR